MMKSRILALVVAVSTTLPASALATDGYFAHGYGMKAKGMGGASTAVVFGTMGGAVNPAQMVLFGSGFDLGADVFGPRRSAARTANAYGLNGTADSGSLWFAMPEFGFNWMFGEKLSFGLTLYGNGGMNTDYPTGQIAANRCGMGAPASNLLCGPGRLGVNLEQMVIAPTVAFRLGAHQAIGISPLIGYQRFSASGVQAFSAYSSAPGSLSDMGTDSSIGLGVRIGWMANLSDAVSVGAAFAPKMKMGAFEKYKGLFAEQGGFDFPANFNAGVAFKPAPGALVALDYQRINYSGVASVGNSSKAQAPLGSAGGPGFGWTDVNVLKLGLSYDVRPTLTVRAGYNHSDNPVQSADVTFNILAPGVIQNHLTLGLSLRAGKTMDVNVAYLHAFENSVSGATAMLPGGGTDLVKMYQNSFGVSITKKLK
ncbi:MAG TPA: outer membrane protein transport protein [Vicinamibacterales bacterium]|jgi:long-chain fatty acid transport protein